MRVLSRLVPPRRVPRPLAAAALAGSTFAGALAAPAAVRAQSPARGGEVRQAVAINPLAIPFGAISAEYERAVGAPGFAVGIGGTLSFGDYTLSDVDREYASLQGKVKYYPSEVGLRGFAIGVTAGLTHGRNDDAADFNATLIRGRTVTAPTLGVVVDYNRFIGRRRRFLLGVGIGARRVLASRLDRDVVGGGVIPDGRFVVGYGF